MKLSLLLLAPAVLAAPQHFSLFATFLAPTKTAPGAIAVSFAALDPDVRLNEEPAPRLKLDAAQRVLLDKQPPAPTRVAAFDPETAQYLDTKLPVTFPVALAPGAPKGDHTVKATVTYFYCSKREGWCRKGSADVDVPVTVP
ncbi:MAG: hypothetical protein HY317_04585 [Acidobacteria bacterium]|nr:hypothetical protein [Acidobacteriota bacterium]